jgi:hypothetical protein
MMPLSGMAEFLALSDGTRRHNYTATEGRIGANPPGESDLVAFADRTIEKDEVIGVAGLLRRAHRLQGLLAGGKASAAHSPTGNLFIEQTPVDFVVTQNQDPQASDVSHRRRCDMRLRIELQRQLEPESGSFAQSALDSDRPSHEVHELFGNGQAQSRAAMSPRGRAVHLAELLKKQSDFLLGNSHACVLHRDPYLRTSGVLQRAMHGDQHMAAGCELDGVADKIGGHLADPRTVSDKLPRRSRGIFQKQVDVLLAGPGGQQIMDFLDDLAKVERISLVSNLPASILE